VEPVNVSVRHGCSLRLRQIRATEANEIPSWTPSNRTDQWATPRCPRGRPSSVNVATTTSISSISGGRHRRSADPAGSGPPRDLRVRQPVDGQQHVPAGTPTRPGSSSTAASPPTGDDHPHAEPATQQPTNSLSRTTHREQSCARDTSCKIRRISAQPSDDHRCRLARPSIVLLTDTAASSQPDGVRRREGGIDAVIVPVAFCSSQSASTHQQCLLHAQMQRRQEPPPAVIALALAGSMCPPREPAHPPARQPRALRRHLTR
jgi:hypothetical protein